MTTVATICLLFADRSETLRELGGGFRGDRAKLSAFEIVALCLAAIAVAAAFWSLSRWVRRREGRGSFHNPKQLFHKLVLAHRLGARERRLLVQAARYAAVPLPACLFLRPDLFDAACQHTELASRADELLALKRKLFSAD